MGNEAMALWIPLSLAHHASHSRRSRFQDGLFDGLKAAL
jgi:hypothetical protein